VAALGPAGPAVTAPGAEPRARSPVEASVELEVLLFASLRDRAGRASLRLRVDGAPATVASLRRALAAAHPVLAASLATSRIAVDQEFRGDDHVLAAGAEVAVIPPVSGG